MKYLTLLFLACGSLNAFAGAGPNECPTVPVASENITRADCEEFWGYTQFMPYKDTFSAEDLGTCVYNMLKSEDYDYCRRR